MKMTFKENITNAPFLQGVVLGDYGTGKSYLAREFAIQSCKSTGINNIMLIDTEDGWKWLKKDKMNNINIIEPQNITYRTDFDDENKSPYMDVINFFSEIKKYIEENPVSCLIIDSCSDIGTLIYKQALTKVNEIDARVAKKRNENFYPKRELSYQDWKFFNNISDTICDIIKEMPCHVILCGLASSAFDYNANAKVVDASERTVSEWKRVSNRFDFTCFRSYDMDINNDITKQDSKESAKNDSKKTDSLNENAKIWKRYKTTILKGRFTDDGRIFDNNDFLEKWFTLFQKMDFEQIKENILNSEDIKSLNKARDNAVQFVNQMTVGQKNEIKNIIDSKTESFNKPV